MKGPLVLNRSYWWKKNPKDEEKVEEKKKEEEKKKSEEKKKELEVTKTVEEKNDNITVTKYDFSNSANKVTLGDVFKMLVSEEGQAEEGDQEGIQLGNSFNKAGFAQFYPPTPRIRDEMVLPAIPLPVRPLLPGFVQNLLISDRRTIQKLRELSSSSERFIGLFLRKEMSSNELSDSPDVIRSIDDICQVGTYISFYFMDS